MTFIAPYSTIYTMTPKTPTYSLAVSFALIFYVSSFPDNALAAQCGACQCAPAPNQDNNNPITEVTVNPEYRLDGGQASSIQVGTRVGVDFTPRDSNRRPTNIPVQPVWDCGSSPVSLRSLCPVAILVVTGPGQVTCNLSVSGVPANKTVSFKVGDGTGGSSGGTGTGVSGSSGDPANANEKACGRKDTSGKYVFCKTISGTETCVEKYSDPSECGGSSTCSVIETTECGTAGGILTKDPAAPAVKADNLGVLIADIFNWSLSVLGIAVFSIIIFSGAQWLLAGGNPGTIGKAKGRIWNAILGAILLLSAYVILKVINPDFVKQSTTLPPIKNQAQTGTGGTGQNPPAQAPVSGTQGASCTQDNECSGQLQCINNRCDFNAGAGTAGAPCSGSNQCSGQLRCFGSFTGTCFLPGNPGQRYGACINGQCDGQLKCADNKYGDKFCDF